MTPVRGKRGRLVHAMAFGVRRDLAPEDIRPILCGKKLRGAIVVDEDIDCDACLSILFEGN